VGVELCILAAQNCPTHRLTVVAVMNARKARCLLAFPHYQNDSGRLTCTPQLLPHNDGCKKACLIKAEVFVPAYFWVYMDYNIPDLSFLVRLIAISFYPKLK
jgi:hypothetical protein